MSAEGKSGRKYVALILTPANHHGITVYVPTIVEDLTKEEAKELKEFFERERGSKVLIVEQVDL